MSATSSLWKLVHGFRAVQVTAAAAGDVTVKASSGAVAAIRTGSGLTSSVIVKDGTTEVWRVSADTRDLFGVPVNFATSIVLEFAGAGDAWVVYL
jgi:hypothetical protein